MKVSVIIPAYNEEKTLAGVLEETLALPQLDFRLEILVSDDGSTDRTVAVGEEFAARDDRVLLVGSSVNAGKTEAIRRALSVATGDVVLVQDADHEYSPADIPALVEPFSRPEVDAVFGSRFLENRWPTEMKLHNWIANRIFTATANLLFGGRLTDEGTALKAVRKNLLMSLDLRSQRFGFCPEVTARLLRRKIPIVEVPVSYSARSRSEGKKPGVRDGLEILWTLLRIRLTG